MESGYHSVFGSKAEEWSVDEMRKLKNIVVLFWENREGDRFYDKTTERHFVEAKECWLCERGFVDTENIVTVNVPGIQELENQETNVIQEVILEKLFFHPAF